MNAEYICTVSVDENNTSWDNFVAGIPGGHHEQTVGWGKLRMFNGWNAKRIILEKNGEIVAGAQVLLRRISFLGNIGYISYGPCIGEKSMDIAEKMILEIKRFARTEKINYLAINLPYFGNDLIPLVKRNRFISVYDGLLPPQVMTSTLLMDLNKSTDVILAEMKLKTRYCVKSAIRKGIEVREGTREDIQLFFDLMISTVTRRNTNPTHPNIRFFELLWDNFHDQGWVRIHVAEYKKEPVCAMLSFSFGNVFRMWKFGWSGKHSKLFPNNALYWKVIEQAKKEGFQYIDFVQVDPDVARMIQQGLPITPELEAHEFCGPTKFKMGFGGEVIQLPNAYCYFPKPFMRFSYIVLGNVLLRQKGISMFVKKMWVKIKRKSIRS